MVILAKIWDWKVIALSYLIGLLASYTTTSVALMMERSATRNGRLFWLFASCVMYGACGIFSLHFCGMLALRLPVKVSYEPSVTAMSLLVAVGGATACFFLKFRNFFRIAPADVEEVPLLDTILEPRAERAAVGPSMFLRPDANHAAGGLLLASTIAAMHFMGIAAIEAEGVVIRHSPLLVICAFLAGWGFSTYAIMAMPSELDFRRQGIFSVLNSLGVFALHYLAMVAAAFHYHGDAPPGERVADINWTIVFTLSVFIVAMCFVAVALVAQTASRQRDDLAEAVRAKRYISALEAERQNLLLESQRKTDFMAIASHEMRTPLHGLAGFMELLSQSSLDPEQSEQMRLAQQSLVLMETTLDNVLNLTQLETGTMPVVLEWTNLPDLIFRTAEALSGMIEQSLVVAFFDEDADGASEYTDAHMYAQVVRNLISNAYKFTQSGYVVIRYNCSAGFARLVVRDSGVGIAPADLPTLFQPYNQRDQSLRRRFSGTGVGLAICRQISDRLKGTLDVESSPGVGSTFTFQVPVVGRGDAQHAARQADGQVAHIVTSSPYEEVRLVFDAAFRRDAGGSGTDAVCDVRPGETRVSMGGVVVFSAKKSVFHVNQLAHQIISRLTVHPEASSPRPAAGTPRDILTAGNTSKGRDRGKILVAEDNPLNQQLVQKFLSRLGWTSALANNGEEVILRLREEPRGYAAVLMDCQMPLVDGYAATRLIRASDEPFQKIPVIALTANVSESSREEARAAGMNHFLPKPLKFMELKRSLEKLDAESGGESQASSTTATPSITTAHNEAGRDPIIPQYNH
jgi:signal transduction histidine kinase/DNA-binding NarL/FixJ family response regulator